MSKMTAGGKRRAFWTLFPLFIGLILRPAIVYIVDLYARQISLSDGFFGFLRGVFRTEHLDPFDVVQSFIFVIAAELIPFVALTAVCFFMAKRMSAIRFRFMAWGGLSGLLAVLVPFYIAYAFPVAGSTAGLAELFMPLWSLLLMTAGLVAGFLLGAVFERRHKP